MASDGDLDCFLSKVDEIGNIIKDLKSDDDSLHGDAMGRADSFLKKFREDEKKKDKTGFDRTLVNRDAYKNDDHQLTGPQLQQDMSQEAFYAAMEKDAKERTERRKKNLEQATTLKELGNTHFKCGQHREAIVQYTKALTFVKDVTAIYTNRAQAYIKVEEYEKAIEDCDWALRVFENCVKAYFHKGKALMMLNKFEEAIDCYTQAAKCDPQKAALIQECIDEVEAVRRANEQEEAAREFLAGGAAPAKGVVELMKKLQKNDQLPMYYSGGLHVLASALQDQNTRTLFRTNGGFILSETQPYLKRILDATPRSLSKQELQVCAALIAAYSAACTDTCANALAVLTVSDNRQLVLRYLETEHKPAKVVKDELVKLLCLLSVTKEGRDSIAEHINMEKLLGCLFVVIKKHKKLAKNASSVMNNMAMEKRTRGLLKNSIGSLAEAFEDLVSDATIETVVVSRCISTLTNLCGEDTVCRKLVARSETWETCHRLMNRIDSEILRSVLGLLINLTHQHAVPSEEISYKLAESCTLLLKSNCDGDLKPRGFQVLSRLLQSSNVIVEKLVEKDHLVQELDDNDDCLKVAVQCLVACTKSNASSRELVVQLKALTRLVSLLNCEDDETLAGNVALCLSHVAMVDGVAARLTKCDVMKRLLVLARDGRQHTVQHNAAILAAKLTNGDKRHLERLRELHGLEILHDVIKSEK